MVLQRNREVELAVAGAEPDVSKLAVELQGSRRSRVGGAALHVPACYSGSPCAALRCLRVSCERVVRVVINVSVTWVHFLVVSAVDSVMVA